jgi:hypothetical protein
MVAKSAIVRKSSVATHPRDPGLGLYALRRFEKRDRIGFYDGPVVAMGDTLSQATERAEAIQSQRDEVSYMMPLRLHPRRGNWRRGWFVVDPGGAPTEPYLLRANDPLSVQEPNAMITEFGAMTALTTIEPVDLTRPLKDQCKSEICWSYESYTSDGYWVA